MMYRNNFQHKKRGDKAVVGIAIALVGVLLLLKKLHLFYFDFSLTWPIVLIVIGILTGIKHRFRNPGAWILIAIGTFNLIPEFTIHGESSRQLVWPAVIIFAGLFIALRPRKNRFCTTPNMNTVTSEESQLNIDVTFGGHKEIVTSKEFRGGNINATFGGCEINLMQADSSVQPIILDLKVSFSGVEIIVPSHWDLQIEIEPSFGSVEDRRMIRTPNAGEERKTLILRGTCSFGSIEIKSY
jgi:Domain of unknown function (DUF5668)/Cell wall-active antibiotics response 4TMS YvqF